MFINSLKIVYRFQELLYANNYTRRTFRDEHNLQCSGDKAMKFLLSAMGASKDHLSQPNRLGLASQELLFKVMCEGGEGMCARGQSICEGAKV